MNLDDYLKTVGDYADQVAAADANANRDTMAVARAMDEMFESGEWVAEWLGQRPEPKRPTARWNPADRNRFIAWTQWKIAESGRKPFTRVRGWQLMEGAATARSVTTVTDLAGPSSELAYRPLYWLRKNRYENRTREVWGIAVKLAGGDPTAVTSAHTKAALADWKARTFVRADGSPKSDRQVTAAGKANRLRRNALDEIAEMYRLACIDDKAKDEYLAFFDDVDAFLEAHKAGPA